MSIDKLNDQQRQAVLHTEGPLLLLAGAGSGKTGVITHRIAYLVGKKHIDPEQLLAVTFTNKAAKEMQARVVTLVGREQAGSITVSTFHALCSRILRSDIERLGYKRNFSIYGVADQQHLVRQLMADIDADHGLNADLILWKIADAKNRLIHPERFGPFMNGDMVGNMACRVYPEYQKSLKSYNAVDFDDLLMLTVRLFDECPDVLERYQERFRYIMVDEYQDTNAAQFELVRRLAGYWKNLCVVGDDDQSIYGWRGAEPGNILDFERHFPGARVIRLEQNYRSTGNILAAANAIIGNNSNRKTKRLWTAGEAGDKLALVTCDDAEEEARAVVERIHGNLLRHRLAYRDHAILLRTNAQTLVFEQELRLSRIPYVLIGGQQFFDRKEVRDAVAYLRFLVNPYDEVNLLRILNYPRRGIGRTTADLLIRASVTERLPLWQILRRADQIAGLSPKAIEAVTGFVALVEGYRGRFRSGTDLAATTRSLFDLIGIADELRRAPESREQSERRVENVEEVVNAVARYTAREAQPTLTGFLETVSLLDRDEPGTNSKEKKLAQDAVMLMSLHSSKGLEFPQVFIPGCEEGFLPHKKSVSERCDVDEERRLFYVGVTRARTRLTLLHARERKKYGKMEPREVSRFLHEIPEDLLRRECRDVLVNEACEEGESLSAMFEKLMALKAG
jgi:superfamily I DNA/RNA helicase